MSSDLLGLLDRLGQPRVLVIGDVMLDRYVWGDAERISQEAPVILLRADRREERLGGASSVATMLRALEATVDLVGLVGADAPAGEVRRLLEVAGINAEGVLVEDGRPTTVKERYVGRAQHRHPQQMIRVDYETRQSMSGAVEARAKAVVTSLIRRADIVLISDYDKGVCTPELTRHAIREANRFGRRTLVDPIRCTAGRSPHPYEKYRQCSSMTPNRLEAGLAVGMTITSTAEALAAAETLRQQFEMEAGIVTLDKDGMALAHTDGRRHLFPTRPRQVYDITGAGDMVLSVLGIALAAGADYDPAIRLANIAGGLEVEKIGVAPVLRSEMRADLVSGQRGGAGGARKCVPMDQVAAVLEPLRNEGQRIVFTNGCFDILHAGHVRYLNEARAQGDLLVVGLNSDASVRLLKGSHRPINSQDDRAEVLAALAAVDVVVIFDEATPMNLIRLVRPHVLVKGADYRREEVVGAEFVEALGGRVHLAAFRPGLSTTQTLRKLAQESNSRRVA